jgi:uncharacterized FlgJ-related protein
MGKPKVKDKPAVDKFCNDQDAVGFVKDYQAEAADLAEQADVPVEFILGLAAEETQWGTGDAANDCNNYFSLHAPVPFQTGSRPAKGDPKVLIAKFDTIHDSGRSFLKRYADSIKGARDPKNFGQRLRDARFNTVRPDFVEYLAGIINAVKHRMACP